MEAATASECLRILRVNSEIASCGGGSTSSLRSYLQRHNKGHPFRRGWGVVLPRSAQQKHGERDNFRYVFPVTMTRGGVFIIESVWGACLIKCSARHHSQGVSLSAVCQMDSCVKTTLRCLEDKHRLWGERMPSVTPSSSVCFCHCLTRTVSCINAIPQN
jgi:hypothetical protein